METIKIGMEKNKLRMFQSSNQKSTWKAGVAQLSVSVTMQRTLFATWGFPKGFSHVLALLNKNSKIKRDLFFFNLTCWGKDAYSILGKLGLSLMSSRQKAGAQHYFVTVKRF